MSYHGKLTAMSYLGPSPRPGRRGPPRHSGPTHGARAALRWPTTHGSARLAPMADHVWPGAPLRCQAAHGPAQAGLADRFAAARMPTSTGRQPASTRKQPTSTRGNRPALRATGQHLRQPGLFRQVWGQSSLSSFSCLRAGRLGAYRGHEAVDRARRLRLKPLPNTGR
jgi:hypothetical protein